MSKEKTKTCKHCKEQIDAKAKRCPHCGGKQKGIFSLLIKVFIVLVVIVIVVAVFAGPSTKQSDSVKEAQAMNVDDFKATCTEVSYDELKRNPDNYKDKAIKVTVEIAQVVSESDGMMRGYSDDAYEEEFVLYDCRTDESATNIIENDTITAYGVYTGMESISRAIGGSDDVPCICIIDVDFK